MDPALLSHASRVPQLIITNSILLFFASVAVWLRFYTRIKITRYFGVDDWWMGAAWIFSLGQFCVWTYYDHIGNAQHVWTLNPKHLTGFYITLWIVQLIYPIGIGLIKMSILALYLRLFPSDNFKIVIRCAMGFIGVMTTATFLAMILECHPIQSNWEDPTWANPHCVDRSRLQYAVSGLTFATDIAVLLMPMKYLIRLRVPTRERIQVIALMSLGGITCIASIVRFKYIGVVGYSSDPTWEGYYLSIWSSLEFHLGVITSCLPALKPLFVIGAGKLSKKSSQDDGFNVEAPPPMELAPV